MGSSGWAGADEWKPRCRDPEFLGLVVGKFRGRGTLRQDLTSDDLGKAKRWFFCREWLIRSSVCRVASSFGTLSGWNCGDLPGKPPMGVIVQPNERVRERMREREREREILSILMTRATSRLDFVE